MRNNVPRAAQEPVAAPLPRCGYPVRFTKGTTGLSIAVEGLLVKHITKSLTLSLPDRTQFMTNTGRQASPGPFFPAWFGHLCTVRPSGRAWRNTPIRGYFPRTGAP